MKKNIRKIFILFAVLLNMNIYATESIPRFRDDQFEQIGREHNAGLEEFFRKIISKEVLITDNNSYTQAVKENYIRGADGLSDNKIAIDKSSIGINLDNLTEHESQLRGIFNSTSTISELNGSIDAAISNLQANSAITNGEYNSIMSMYVVAKHSAYFWYDVSEGGSGMGNRYMKDLVEIYPSLFATGEEIIFSKASAKAIAEDDALGAAWGGVTWCAATAWTGAGSVAGFVYGLVSGAITSSLNTAARGINMEYVCASYVADPYCFSDKVALSDEWGCMWEIYTDFLCCRITQFKPQHCSRYIIKILGK